MIIKTINTTNTTNTSHSLPIHPIIYIIIIIAIIYLFRMNQKKKIVNMGIRDRDVILGKMEKTIGSWFRDCKID